ncbi:TIGR02281 family clan AA aspartic protease [Sphingomonas sp. R86521]|uniref:retropepsin-like aspartic protease family protein n=1 Tax=Sphingomonas sp. R86521 TaxID=3093860 RepID=UPI0036D42561
MTNPEWQHLAIYAIGAALVLLILLRIPYLGGALRALFSIGLLASCLFLVFQQAPFIPGLARLTENLGIDDQTINGRDVRIRMSPDGHFWARATINGSERRMLVDSGATITALSERTASAAAIDRRPGVVPLILQTANGNVRADAGRIDTLRLGSITARNLRVVTSPALGETDILGMNFLSQLRSWRVEGRTLILVPHHPQAAIEQSAGAEIRSMITRMRARKLPPVIKDQHN